MFVWKQIMDCIVIFVFSCKPWTERSMPGSVSRYRQKRIRVLMSPLSPPTANYCSKYWEVFWLSIAFHLVKSELLVCACSRSLARAGSHDSSGLSGAGKNLCSVPLPWWSWDGAAQEHSPGSAGLHRPEHSPKLIHQEEIWTSVFRIETSCYVNFS